MTRTVVQMSTSRAQPSDVTPIEIAVDLEAQQLTDAARTMFSGPAEPRVCLVLGFVLTSQLRHVIGAIDRAVPQRLPPRLRVAPATTRSSHRPEGGGVMIQPMHDLLRLQSKLIHAIEPGLAQSTAVAISGALEKDESAARFIHEFIPANMLPTFEPASIGSDFAPIDLDAIGLTIYELGAQGLPQGILCHWSYVPSAHNRLHLRRGP